MKVDIRQMEPRDAQPLSAGFDGIGVGKPVWLFERYLAEQADGRRTSLVACLGNALAGYINVVWQPAYPPFAEGAIPEVQDFNVLPPYRRRGIGALLMDRAEALAFARSPVVGIGVGLTADYGTAHRMYMRRGYLPDGFGLSYGNRHLQYGDTTTLDDELVLHFTKTRESVLPSTETAR